jgi:peptide-methionine (S)-S-oxide reductase
MNVDAENIQELALGGGCHWCTEAVFQAVPGVREVKQGYLKSVPPHDSWSEGVIICYNPDQVDLEQLLDIHLQTHASTVNHSRRADYRSAIYYHSQSQYVAVEAVMFTLSRKRNQHYITQLLTFESFRPSRISIQEYYRTRPEAPFCQRYIVPKLEKVAEMLAATNK